MKDSPMDLQCLAAKCVGTWLIHEWADGEIPVIDVWKNLNKYNTCSNHDWFLWQLYEMEVPRFANLDLPNKTRFLIEDYMWPILCEVVSWFQFHHARNFFHDPQPSPLNEYVVKLVWNHDFEIDYVATAKNILTNEKLNPLERFRFASTYCIVEEMHKFRDLMADSLPEWEFFKDLFVVYWSKYLKNELHTIPLPIASSGSIFSLGTMIIAETLRRKLDLWPAVVYFFDKVGSAEKFYRFGTIVEQYSKRHLKDLLAKLTDYREWKLASRSAIMKMVEKIVEYGTLNDVRSIWQLFQSEMDSKDFCDILETLVPLSMENANNFEKWTPLLMEIWSSARPELKQSAIDVKLLQSIGEKCNTIFSRVSRNNEETPEFRARRQISDPMNFIRLVLKSMDAENRAVFFKTNFFWMILWAPFAKVDKLVREFLPLYNHDIVKLETDVATLSEMKRSLLILVEFGEFDEFHAAISFYFPGVGSLEYSVIDKEMLESLFDYKYRLNLNASNASEITSVLNYLVLGDWSSIYEHYLKMNSHENTYIAPDVLTRLLTLMEEAESDRLNKICLLIDDGLRIKYLNEYFSTNLSPNHPTLIGLKERFKDRMHRFMFDPVLFPKRSFNRADTQDFLLWIYNGDENLVNENFKQPHLFDEGFLVHFYSCFPLPLGFFQVAESMEEFLKWCFETEEERQQFKRQMIYKFRKFKLIDDTLACRWFRRPLLYWFFDGDANLIEKFTAECGSDPIHTVNVASNSDPEADDDGDE